MFCILALLQSHNATCAVSWPCTMQKWQDAKYFSAGWIENPPKPCAPQGYCTSIFLAVQTCHSPKLVSTRLRMAKILHKYLHGSAKVARCRTFFNGLTKNALKHVHSKDIAEVSFWVCTSTSVTVQHLFQQGCAWPSYCTSSFVALPKWHDAKHFSARLAENLQNHVHRELTEIFSKLCAWRRYCTSIFMALQKWLDAEHFSAGLTANHQIHVQSKDTAEVSFWLCQSVTVQNFFQQGCAWPRYCTSSFVALPKWHHAKHFSARLAENPQQHAHRELTEIFPKLRAWLRYCTSIFTALQKWHNVRHFSAGLTENPPNHVHSKNTAEISFWVCESITVQNLFQADKNAPYLCSAHGFGGSLSALLKYVLHRGTFAEPERYLYIFCTVPLLQSHEATCAISLPCTTLLKKVLDYGTFGPRIEPYFSVSFPPSFRGRRHRR